MENGNIPLRHVVCVTFSALVCGLPAPYKRKYAIGGLFVPDCSLGIGIFMFDFHVAHSALERICYAFVFILDCLFNSNLASLFGLVNREVVGYFA
jgi:hypothetical protein